MSLPVNERVIASIMFGFSRLTNMRITYDFVKLEVGNKKRRRIHQFKSNDSSKICTILSFLEGLTKLFSLINLKISQLMHQSQTNETFVVGAETAPLRKNPREYTF